jgi:hypothetical protein
MARPAWERSLRLPLGSSPHYGIIRLAGVYRAGGSARSARTRDAMSSSSDRLRWIFLRSTVEGPLARVVFPASLRAALLLLRGDCDARRSR